MLPVKSLKGFGVEYRVDEVNFQPGAMPRVARDFVLHEVPAHPQHFVVTPILLRLIPGEQSSFRIEDSFVHGELRVDIPFSSARG